MSEAEVPFLSHTQMHIHVLQRETSRTYTYSEREKEQKDVFSKGGGFFGGWGKSIRFFLEKQCEISLFIP